MAAVTSTWVIAGILAAKGPGSPCTRAGKLSTRSCLRVVRVVAAVDADDDGDEEVSLGQFRRPGRAPAGQNGTASFPVVLQQNLERLTLPGQVQELHFYDTSNLAALRAALSNNRRFVHAALDSAAAAQRRFVMMDVGTECTVERVVPSTKSNTRGEASASAIVDVRGLRQIRIGPALQSEPFVVATAAAVHEGPGGVREGTWAHIDDGLLACRSLRADLGLARPPPPAELPARELHAGSVRALAIMATLQLPVAQRVQALQLCDAEELLAYVRSCLEEEEQRLRVLRALRELGEP